MHIKWKIRKILTRLKVWPFFELLRMLLHFLIKKPHDPEFLGLKHLGIKGLCLDLGANQGQSAITILSLLPNLNVLSFEPNPAMEPYLSAIRRLLGRRFDYKIAAVGDNQGELTLFIPSIDGVDLSQEVTAQEQVLKSNVTKSRLIKLTGKDNYSTRTFKIPVLKLDHLNLNPSLIKLDLQGMEIQAINGIMQTIKNYRPIIIMELSTDFEELIGSLKSLTYSAAVFDTNKNCFIKYPAIDSGLKQIDNVYFFPTEKLPKEIA